MTTPHTADDPTEIRTDEFHPAARSAYRWLKGFMVTNQEDYLRYRLSLSIAAEHGNRQAQICMGTIRRLQKGQPISDRYLLGLCWTILLLHNPEAESIAEQRVDKTYGPDDSEFRLEEASE